MEYPRIIESSRSRTSLSFHTKGRCKSGRPNIRSSKSHDTVTGVNIIRTLFVVSSLAG